MSEMYLKLTSPDVRRHIINKAAGEVALNTANQVVVLGMSTLTDDTEGVIFLDSGPRDTSEDALLHATFEAEDGHLGRWELDMNRNLANEAPWECDKDSHDQREPERLREEDSLRGKDVLMSRRVPKIPKDGEAPGGDNTRPARKPVETLEDTGRRSDFEYKRNPKTYLWWLFRTHGKAANMAMITVTKLISPSARTEGWYNPLCW
jgi:hypothetical protein